MSDLKQEIHTVCDSDHDHFDAVVNSFLDEGWQVKSTSSCCDQAFYYTAILTRWVVREGNLWTTARDIYGAFKYDS